MRRLIIATVALVVVSSTALAQSTDKGAAPAAGDPMSKGDMSKDTMAGPINMERRRDEMETSTRTMAADLASRARDIHWAAGFEPEHADLFAHNETLINTSCETVWQHIVNVKAWPQWYPNARDVSLIGGADTLMPDVRWRWTTFGLEIESRVHEFEPGRRLAWFGGAPGEKPTFYHSWLLSPDGKGCRVTMDEAGIGPGAAAFRKADEGRMHRGHEMWLATLKWVSEGR